MSDTLLFDYAAKAGTLRGALIGVRNTLTVALDFYGRDDDDLSRMTREALDNVKRAIAENEAKQCA